MTNHERSDRDRRLGEILRDGDPATAQAGLTAAEIQEMRRTALSAVPERQRAFLLAPALATAAAVALSFVVVLSLWRAHQVTPAPPAGSATTAETPVVSTPAPAPVIHTPVVPAPPQVAAVQPQMNRLPAHAVRRRPAAVTPHAAAPAAPQVAERTDEEIPKRQVQFATPGGTRIIWMLPEKSR